MSIYYRMDKQLDNLNPAESKRKGLYPRIISKRTTSLSQLCRKVSEGTSFNLSGNRLRIKYDFGVQNRRYGYTRRDAINRVFTIRIDHARLRRHGNGNVPQVTLAAMTNGTVTVSPTGPAQAGATVTLTAVPASGYELHDIKVLKDPDNPATAVETLPATSPQNRYRVASFF